MDRRGIAEFMHATAGPAVVAELQWDLPEGVDLGPYREPVADTLLLVESDDPETVAPQSLRAAARVELWRAVMEQTVAHYDVTPPDGVRMIRQKMHEHARTMYRIAYSEARGLGLPGLSRPLVVYREAVERRVGAMEPDEPEFG